MGFLDGHGHLSVRLLGDTWKALPGGMGLLFQHKKPARNVLSLLSLFPKGLASLLPPKHSCCVGFVLLSLEIVYERQPALLMTGNSADPSSSSG